MRNFKNCWQKLSKQILWRRKKQKDNIPDSLDDNQKEIKIKNIIYSLNKKGIIKKSGKAAKYAKWILPENQ